jgi:rRNA maturation endonuclease Nob1
MVLKLNSTLLMKKNIKLKILKDELKHIQHYNSLAPFPVFDTEYVEAVNNTIKNMKDKKVDYDDEPVVACKHCKKLYIVVDDVDNDICMRCGSVNETRKFENIKEYIKYIEETK